MATGPDKFVKDSKRTGTPAATYAKLASLENFQRIALNHEQRQHETYLQHMFPEWTFYRLYNC